MDIRRNDASVEDPHHYESMQMDTPSNTKEEVRTTHTHIVLVIACGVFLIIGVGLGLMIGYFAFSQKANQSENSEPDMTTVSTSAACEAEHIQSRTCADIMTASISPKSGVYVLCGQHRPITVYCDMDSGNGGWTVFQRRKNGVVKFRRDWADYKTGFGQLDGEFWLGNENLHILTSISRPNLLQIDLEDWEGHTASIIYSGFYVENEANNYKLRLQGACKIPNGIGDSFFDHRDTQFATYDHDHDGCVAQFHGGWWYSDCHDSNLNGLYYSGGWHNTSYATGMDWSTWRGYYYSMKKTEMKFRPGICNYNI